MRPPNRACLSVLGALCAITSALSGASAQTLMDQVPAPARHLEVVEHLGETLPADLEFVNSDGKVVRLGDYFSDNPGKPAIVAMVYFRCATACSTVLTKLTDSLNQLDFTVGKDFNTLIFDFNQDEGTVEAAAAKYRYTSGYPRARDPETLGGWQFHTGTPEASLALSQAIGFPYRRLEDGEYSHPICIFVISPKGVISRYVYGYDYNPSMVKLALLEASEGKIARTIGDRFMHLCYRYDASAGKYTLHAFRLMQIAGAVTVLAVGGLIVTLRINETVRRRRVALTAGLTPPPGANLAGGTS